MTLETAPDDLDFYAGLVLVDRVLFRKEVFKDEITLEPSWEQKLMWCDESPRKLYCTGRKIAKCIAGDTLIVDPYTGRRQRADHIEKGPLDVASLAGDWRIWPTKAKIWPNEVVPVFKVTTRSGSSIRVSGNHPFLTGSGWANCEDLKPGDLVGMARKMPMPTEDTSGLEDCEVALVAYLLGDGGISGSTLVFTTASPDVLQDFTGWLNRMDRDLSLRRRGKYDYVVVANKKFKRHEIVNPLRRRLVELGLNGKNSHTKFIPDAIFALGRDGLKLFLSRLYATDGYATRSGSIGYASVSLELIKDLRELLLRFGIFARIYPKKTHLGGVSYSLEICDSQDVIRFASEIGIFSKEAAVQAAVDLAVQSGPSKHDRIPLQLVRTVIEQSGVGVYTAGVNAGVRLKSSYEVSRSKALKVGWINRIGDLINLADGHVYWDEIESITPDGEELTYDLNVPGSHNFVANGFITHNTIDLEADVIQTGLLTESEGTVEALFFTPSDVHMNPFLDRVWNRLDRNILLGGFVAEKKRGDNSILRFKGGLLIYFRIEGLSGTDRNVVGLRAHYIWGDEQAFGTYPVFNSLLQTALPFCHWVLAGVPNGVRRSPFYELDQTDRGKSWSRHKYPTHINPLYDSEEAKQKLIEDYGGEKSHGYITQVLGEWGEELFSSFPPGSIAIGAHPYITQELFALGREDMRDLGLILKLGSQRVKRFVLALDYGYSPDPSVLGVVAQLSDEDVAEDVWRLVVKLTMRRIAQPHQIDIIQHVRTKVFTGEFVGFSSDHLPTVQLLKQAAGEELEELYRHFMPGGSTTFEVNKLREREPEVYRILSDEARKAETVNIPNKQLSTERLRNWMINAVTPFPGRKLWLGPDPDLQSELGGTTEKKTQSGHTVYYGPPDPSDKKRLVDHDTDMLRHATYVIYEAMLSLDAQYSEDELLAAMGWAETESETGWQAPW